MYQETWNENKLSKVSSTFTLALRETINFLVLAAVFFLPFQKAFSLHLGIVLKLTDLLIVLAIGFAIIQFVATNAKFDLKLFKKLMPLYGFVFASFLSWIFALYNPPNSDLSFKFAPNWYATLKWAQILLSAGSYIFMAAVLSRIQTKTLLNLWLAGTFVSFAYLLYTQVSYLMTGYAYLLPGLDRHQMIRFDYFVLPRSGTFEEGNIAGPYYLLSFFLCLVDKRKLMAAISLVAMFLSFSMSAMLGFLFFLFAYAVITKRVRIHHLLIGFMALVVYFSFFSGLLKDRFSEHPGSSFNVRLNESVTGLKMFWDSPIFGQGLSYYSYNFRKFEWNPYYSSYSDSLRRIPNNIYVELMSEGGLICVLSFCFFWWAWASRGPRNLRPFMVPILMGLCMVGVAYASYNTLVVWLFAAVLAYGEFPKATSTVTPLSKV